MPWLQLLSFLLMLLIGSAFGATSVSSHQPGVTSALGAANGSSDWSETVAKSTSRWGEAAVSSSGIGHPLMSTNGSSYQNRSATGSLRGSTKYATNQETEIAPFIFLDPSSSSILLELSKNLTEEFKPYLTSAGATCPLQTGLNKRESNSLCTSRQNCLVPLVIRALKQLSNYGRQYWGSVSSTPPPSQSYDAESVATVAQTIGRYYSYFDSGQLITTIAGTFMTFENPTLFMSLSQVNLTFNPLCRNPQTSSTMSTSSCRSATIITSTSLPAKSSVIPPPCATSGCRSAGPDSQGQFTAGVCDDGCECEATSLMETSDNVINLNQMNFMGAIGAEIYTDLLPDCTPTKSVGPDATETGCLCDSTLYSTLPGPTQSACSYTAYGQLSSPLPVNCAPVFGAIAGVGHYCTCDHDVAVPESSWLPPTPSLTNSRDEWATTWGCMTGQTIPTPTVTTMPGPTWARIINPGWSVALYPVNKCAPTAFPYPTFGATLSGTSTMSCQTVQQAHYYGAGIQVVYQPQVDNLCLQIWLENNCARNPDYRICATSTKTLNPTSAATPTTNCFSQLGFSNEGEYYVVGAFRIAKTTANVITVKS